MSQASSPKSGGRVNALFHWIAEPKVVRVVLFLSYLAVFFGGLGAIFTPPTTVSDVLGATLSDLLGMFVTIGGLFASAAVLPGVWWLERVGIGAIAVGLSMYSVVVYSLQITEMGNRGLQLAVILALIGGLTSRFLTIRGAALDPKV